MIAAARFLSASGAGESFFRFSIALSAMPLLGPSFAGRSNSTVSTPALVRCAAICAPITPAPSTAALRMRSADEVVGAAVIGFSIRSNSKDRTRQKGTTNTTRSPWRSGDSLLGVAQAGGGEADQVGGGLLAVLLLADVVLALDHAEAGHRVSEGAGDQVDAPVQLGLFQMRQQSRELGGELAHDMAVVLRQELAQRVVVLGEGARQHA